MTPAADPRLARLLQLASPALPVGAYSYSQGLESAVEAGIVRDTASAARWIREVLEFSIARIEAPTLLRLIAAWCGDNRAAVKEWNALFLASRESAELRAETVQMGYSLAKLLTELGVAEGLDDIEEVSFPAAFAMGLPSPSKICQATFPPLSHPVPSVQAKSTWPLEFSAPTGCLRFDPRPGAAIGSSILPSAAFTRAQKTWS